jgi:hypothetical protein
MSEQKVVPVTEGDGGYELRAVRFQITDILFQLIARRLEELVVQDVARQAKTPWEQLQGIKVERIELRPSLEGPLMFVNPYYDDDDD